MARHRLPVTQGVEEIELFVSPFAGIGRMAHLQRHLSSLQHVRAVRIGGLVDQTARFLVTLDPGSCLSVLVLANTVVVGATSSRLDLRLRSSAGRPRQPDRRRELRS